MNSPLRDPLGLYQLELENIGGKHRQTQGLHKVPGLRYWNSKIRDGPPERTVGLRYQKDGPMDKFVMKEM